MLWVAACSGGGNTVDNTEFSTVIETTTTVGETTTTTISVAEQTAKDEQLFREVLYFGQQEFMRASGSSQEYESWWKQAVEYLYPAYREFITDTALESCLARQLSSYSSFTVSYGTLELGSSFATPDWTLDVELPDGTIKSFRPSEFGRTYLVRTTFIYRGYESTEKTTDIHYVIIGDKAFYFWDFDYCLDLK